MNQGYSQQIHISLRYLRYNLQQTTGGILIYRGLKIIEQKQIMKIFIKILDQKVNKFKKT